MIDDRRFRLRDLAQEVYELGPKGTAFRVFWELRGLADHVVPDALRHQSTTPDGAVPEWTLHLPFADPAAVADAVRDRIPAGALDRLADTALDACKGRIECFGGWQGDYGAPIDWHRNPVNGARWDPRMPWRRTLSGAPGAGDVKLVWEIGRFPHAYHLARGAAFFPERLDEFGSALAKQIRDFHAANPPGLGVHWASGQEVAFRLLAWLFAADTLLTRISDRQSLREVHDAMLTGAAHIERHLDYARHAVYNNHLLSEALALFAVAALLARPRHVKRWRELGRTILDGESRRQFYPDGGYIQQSHNYHRVAIHDLLWACAFAKSMGDRPSASWLDALDRSVVFLVAHQNPADGRLPNYGSNDGSNPGLFSTCEFSDFRPALQTAHLLARGERLYEPGPWDEMPAWFLGPLSLDAPLAPPARTSVSFRHTGYHVLRGRSEETFATFRCGSLLDRFSQIDMLHVDVWWRGLNVLVDPGSFLYNDRAEWHNHFMRTAAHNTISIDGRDQMLHFRQFKVLYWTHAALLGFEDTPAWALCAGEHTGYSRHAGGGVHRRSVLFVKDDLFVIVDRVSGDGRHGLRLHWLGGAFPYTFDASYGRLELETSAGPFGLTVFGPDGRTLEADVVAGQEDPPRGWLSRHYGQRTPVPSFAVSGDVTLPATFVTIASPGRPHVQVDGEHWLIDAGDRRLAVRIADGRCSEIAVTAATPPVDGRACTS